jgi:hypothetical protein
MSETPVILPEPLAFSFRNTKEPSVAGEYVDCTDYKFMHMVNC